MEPTVAPPAVTFETNPDQYKHWKLTIDGAVATLAMDVREDAGLRPNDYKLKLNSYDLGVDIELADVLQRLRFEHPEVHVVVMTSLKPRIFCAGANIFMLGTSSHAFKVNFCKFTNETRLGMEDMSANSGIKFLAAVNGICAGGGYELALACDEIVLADDGSSAVSFPEAPLLAVLPGTGGLTRLVDKRKIRRDLADAFQRIRFEHPEVCAIVVTSGKDRIFCSGANIYMLGSSTHGFKVNFCKFTNETRLYLEEMSAESGLPSLCALNGTGSGGRSPRSSPRGTGASRW